MTQYLKVIWIVVDLFAQGVGSTMSFIADSWTNMFGGKGD